MFRCKVCGWLHAGEVPPDSCPSCGAPADRFRPVSTGLSPSDAGSTSVPPDARLRLLALVPATIDTPFARRDGPRIDVMTGDDVWFDDNIPCMRACPVSTDVATYIGHVAGGAFDLAAQLNREQNIFAGTLSRTCSRPCEDACRRVVIDGPVQIRALKRVATDNAAPYASPGPAAISSSPPGRTRLGRVAVVGAGVAGLTIARELQTDGHAVTVFERDARPGGLMVSGVPAWRLPRAIADADVAAVTALGVKIRTGRTLGRDLTIAQLSETFDAVAVATGAQLPNRMEELGPPHPGSDLMTNSGWIDGLAFLRQVATGEQRPSGPVVVLGGGYTAFDCARTARRLAPGAVTIATRQSGPEATIADEWKEAIAEGVVIESGVTAVGTERNAGAVVGIMMEDGSRSRRLVPCSLLITALGQRPDQSVMDQSDGWIGDTLETATNGAGRFGGWPNVWIAGDAVSGSSSFIEAIASGKRTARDIDHWLGAITEGRPASPNMQPMAIPLEIARQRTDAPGEDAEIPRWTRHILHRRLIEAEPYREIPAQPTRVVPLPERGLASTDAAVEVDAGMTATIGQREAARCLQCQANIFIDGDRCILCNGCVDVCPYGCIEMLGLERLATIDGRATGGDDVTVRNIVAMTIDEDSCIRCGKCVDWCPTSCLTMSAHRPMGGGEPLGFDVRSLLTDG
jgi:formate dehydrogenase beta subunit